MNALGEFVFAAVLMIIVGIAVPFLYKSIFRGKSEQTGHRSSANYLHRSLYGIFLGILLVSPGVSYVLATKFESSPSSGIVFLVIGAFVLVSLPLTLLIAWLFGEQQYEGYWRYLEAGSKVGRRHILITWLCVTLMTFVIGSAMLL